MKNFEVFGHRTFLLNNRIIFKLLQHNIAQDFLCKTFWLSGCPLGGAPCLFHHFCPLCLQHHAYSLLCILGLSVLGYNEEIQSQFQLNALSPPLKVLCFFFFFTPWSISRPLLSNHFSATIDGITSDADPPDALTSIVSCSNV